MVRPERFHPNAMSSRRGSCCDGLAGESPATVIAGEPCSRLRTTGEIPASEWSVESPQAAARLLRGEQDRGPSMKRTLQPREIRTRKRGQAEPVMSRRRQQTAPEPGPVQDSLGVERTARGDSPSRNRRDPHRRPTSGRSDPHKPTVKGDQAGRESEGFVVPRTPGENPGRGKGPCFGRTGVWR